ncbi:hypothetical protein E1281_11620 [Actinomadura sp. KC345]|uniref:hypothetical protein n=1 Tax=Actinomadura sp. KC345 TaxID=2530371 RepID=UPI0010485572|nr:hypothetical protein [Actinomadura sp. KC345]TDC55628.1 hypothetical protein E1281_11620 [Actinomadura sp. KC345]
MKKVQYVIDHGEAPSLIVTGGDAHGRALVAAAYVSALDASGFISVDAARWAREADLSALDPGVASVPGVKDAVDTARSCPLLVVSEVGKAQFEVQHDHPDLFGYAPMTLFHVLDERATWIRPTVITSGLPVGNPPIEDLSVNDPPDADRLREANDAGVVIMGGPNRGLQNALEARAAAGWRVPSADGGYDPDALLVEAGTLSLQQHLGGKSWWRIYMAALGTAVDAGQLLAP